MSRGPDTKGLKINMAHMVSNLLSSTFGGHYYNIKHISRTCIVFGRLLLPTYPDFFWFTWGLGWFTIGLALVTARARNPLPVEVRAHSTFTSKAATNQNQDTASEEDSSSDEGGDSGYDDDNDDDDDDSDSDYYDENGDFPPDDVDFDSLDEDGQKAFLVSVSLSSLQFARMNFTDPTDSAGLAQCR